MKANSYNPKASPAFNPHPQRWHAHWLAAAMAALWLAGPMAAGEPAVSAKNRLTFTSNAKEQTLQVSYQGRPVLVYAFASSQFKPYVRALYTLAGDNVLRDAPADHLHHHGLMYAIKVNGINFWEERDDPGHQKSAAPPAHRLWPGPDGLATGVITHLLHWVSHKDSVLPESGSAALLIENRTLSVRVDEANDEVAVVWQSEFKAGPGADKAMLTGASYHGLGLRLPQEFDHVAQHQNSENLPYSAEQKLDLTAARWSAVSHPMNGHEVMAALFAHPANPGETRFFTMLNAFAYLSVTQNLEQKPLEYKRGDSFTLKYLLAVYSKRKTPDFLNQRHESWLKSPARAR